MPETCIVTVAHGRHAHLGHQLPLLSLTDPESTHVVVAMDDPAIADVVEEHRGGRNVTVLSIDSDPGGLPLARARNVGVRHAVERGVDLIVLLDVDCVLAAGALSRYIEAAAAHPLALLCGPVTYLKEDDVVPERPGQLAALRSPHPVRPDPAPGRCLPGGNHDLFWSLSAALTPSTWARVGGFCEEYVGYGGEDTDFSWVARSRDVDVVWVGGADAYHQYHPISSPPVEHIDAIVRNAHVFHRRWDSWPMRGWLTAFAERGLVSFDDVTLTKVE